MTKQYCDFCGEEQKQITTITFDREAGKIESCDECVVRLKAIARAQAWRTHTDDNSRTGRAS